LIFAQNDAPTTAFLIESGRVEISAMQEGRVRILGELGAGELLGEMAVIDAAPRLATARALTDCVLITIDREQFHGRLAAADPVVRALLMSQLAHYRSALATLTGYAERHVQAASSDDVSAFEKIRLESELRSALTRNELDVRLQPIQRIATGSIAGYEALIRWEHPQRGQVSPAEFIRLAEETSLIVPVGEYVLRRVCEMLVELRARGHEPLPFIALNVSARQLEDPQLIDRMLDQLRAHELPPDSLEIEITEGLVLDTEAIATLLDRCRRAGMLVALDDFGTGYSNLGPLLTLGFDRIKLDQTFVRTIDNPRGAALVKAIVEMAKALDCELIAEGVETEAQLEALRGMGCDFAQGWFIGRPVALQSVHDSLQVVHNRQPHVAQAATFVATCGLSGASSCAPQFLPISRIQRYA
jgi:EAL domain-containing protein (putative c-di-GMP-specific phosphodiesterase class I)